MTEIFDKYKIIDDKIKNKYYDLCIMKNCEFDEIIWFLGLSEIFKKIDNFKLILEDEDYENFENLNPEKNDLKFDYFFLNVFIVTYYNIKKKKYNEYIYKTLN